MTSPSRHGQRAETLGFNPQGHIELAPEILEGDSGGQFDDFRLRKVLPDPGEQAIIHSLTGDRHLLGELQGEAFSVGKERAVPTLDGGAVGVDFGGIEETAERLSIPCEHLPENRVVVVRFMEGEQDRPQKCTISAR